jgi:hypothetical protein
MLSSVSWSQYITIIILVLTCYYAFVVYKYFRWEVLSFIGIKKIENEVLEIPVLTNLKKQFVTENHNDYLPRPSAEVDISPLVQAFTDEVQAYVDEARANSPKPELMYSLQQIAAKYKALKEADCKTELQQFVYEVTNNKFPGLIEKEDTEILWV